MNSLLWVAAIGLTSSLLAERFVKGHSGCGVAGDIAVGAIGALFGGFLIVTLEARAASGLLSSLIVATIGAVIFLMALPQFKRA